MAEREFDLDRNLFALAFAVVRGNAIPCAAATLLLLASNAVTGFIDMPFALAALRAMILILVGHSAYRFLLSGGGTSGWRAVATPEGGMPWRYAGVMLFILAPILLLGIVWNAPGTGIGPSTFGDLALGLVMVLVYVSLYILIGTALPAVAERGVAPLGEAFRRGRRNYLTIGRSLVLGVWLFRTGSLLVMIVLGVLGFTTDFFPPGQQDLQLAATWPMLFWMSCHVFAECLTAVVLVRAYRRLN